DLDPLRSRDDLDSLRSRDQSWIATAGQLPSRPPQTSQQAPQTPGDADDDDRFGTVGAVGVGRNGKLWACTSTGGRGHEEVGRGRATPPPAGNYTGPRVAMSATGFGEQILDLNVCGRIATRVLDGATLEDALRRTFDEVVAHGALLGVIAITDKGVAGYA